MSTRRRPNLLLWAGFLVVVLGVISYFAVFAAYPITRDIPWANFLIFLAGGGLLAVGLKRAYGSPDQYRGRISGTILGALAAVLIGLFCYGVFVLTKVPVLQGAAKTGDAAPAFTLANSDGVQVRLADLLQGRRAALLIFYRGYW